MFFLLYFKIIISLAKYKNCEIQEYKNSEIEELKFNLIKLNIIKKINIKITQFYNVNNPQIICKSERIIFFHNL